jgi:hypothetical protein
MDKAAWTRLIQGAAGRKCYTCPCPLLQALTPTTSPPVVLLFYTDEPWVSKTPHKPTLRQWGKGSTVAPEDRREREKCLPDKTLASSPILKLPYCYQRTEIQGPGSWSGLSTETLDLPIAELF